MRTKRNEHKPFAPAAPRSPQRRPRASALPHEEIETIPGEGEAEWFGYSRRQRNGWARSTRESKGVKR